MKGFVHDMMNSFNIGPNAVQVGVDTFQTSVKAEFYMNTYQDRPSVQQAINNIAYHSGLTHTGEALRFMHTDSFSAAHEPIYPTSPSWSLTDSQTTRPSRLRKAKAARDAGITILAIGVGHGVVRSELNEIASDPDSTHVFTADSFSALSSLNALLSTKACEVSKPHAQPHTAPNCAAKADVAFILDSSGSIGATNYQKMLQFVRDVTSKFDVGPDKDAYTTIFNQNNGDRPGIPNIAIVVTDGRSTNRPNTLAEAQKLRNSGVQVFAVGVGGGVDTSELNAIASDPDSSHMR
ncbi:MATN1-like protein [Mya arenaria]|uniref:MATN1-like protein n=1 Tax=Mya arenaria TaxID=6604 RepID=A0ABY7G9X2_MYAAR|nr:MATN1-like protein [Mya arenaria]